MEIVGNLFFYKDVVMFSRKAYIKLMYIKKLTFPLAKALADIENFYLIIEFSFAFYLLMYMHPLTYVSIPNFRRFFFQVQQKVYTARRLIYL